jgi:glycine cleavage system aminomethyltransferase T
LTRYELHVPSSKAAEFYESLTTAGREYETSVGVPVRPIGYRAIDSMSAEKGYRHWHADIGSGDTPMEAGVFFSSFFPLIFRRFYNLFFARISPPPTHTPSLV